jgi:hypothetical protein
MTDLTDSDLRKNSFVFYRGFSDAIDELPDAEQLQMYRAIKNYALDKQEPNFTGEAKRFFMLIKPQLDANYKKFVNGHKGGAPKGNKNAQKNNRKTTKNNQKQPKTT